MSDVYSSLQRSRLLIVEMSGKFIEYLIINLMVAENPEYKNAFEWY